MEIRNIIIRDYEYRWQIRIQDQTICCRIVAQSKEILLYKHKKRKKIWYSLDHSDHRQIMAVLPDIYDNKYFAILKRKLRIEIPEIMYEILSQPLSDMGCTSTKNTQNNAEISKGEKMKISKWEKEEEIIKAKDGEIINYIHTFEIQGKKLQFRELQYQYCDDTNIMPMYAVGAGIDPSAIIRRKNFSWYELIEDETGDKLHFRKIRDLTEEEKVCYDLIKNKELKDKE